MGSIKFLDLKVYLTPLKLEGLENGSFKVMHKPHKLKKGELPSKCDICDLSFDRSSVASPSQRLFYIHYANIHLKCFKCPAETFDDRKEVLIHLSLTHPELKVKCDMCDYLGFDTSHTLKKHNKCGKCAKIFESYGDLQSHYKDIHEHDLSDYKVPCPECGKTYLTRTAMQQHVNKAHLNIKRHFCDLCDKGFYFRVHLKGHMEDVHERKHEVQCEVCEVRVRSQEGLENHMKTMHEAKSHDKVRCEMCDYQGPSERALKDHIESRHETKNKKKCHNIL